MGQCCCICKHKVNSDCDKKHISIAVIETNRCSSMSPAPKTPASKIPTPSNSVMSQTESRAESIKSSSSNKDEIQATPLVRPNKLDLNLEEETVTMVTEETQTKEPEEDKLEEPSSVEEETPQTDCTVVSCVSRGASCTPSEIRRSLLIPPLARPVSSVEFLNATQELLSPTKVHGWGHHHTKLSKRLQNPRGDSSKNSQKQKHTLHRSQSEDFPKDGQKHKSKHHHSKHRRYWEDSAIHNGKRKHGSSKRKKGRHHKDRRSVVSAAADIPAYRVPPIAVL